MNAVEGALVVSKRRHKRVCRRSSTSKKVVAMNNGNSVLAANNRPDSSASNSNGTHAEQANKILLRLNDGSFQNDSSNDIQDHMYHATTTTTTTTTTGDHISYNDTTNTNTNTTSYPILCENEAKRQIQLICRTPACWRSDSDQSRMVFLLQQFPSLASQSFDWDYNLFWEHGNEWSSPLSFLLASEASLDMIQTVHNLYPAAIFQPSGIHRDLPLHFACRFGVTEDIIYFLLSKFPLAVAVSNSSGMLPIHCALGKKDVVPYGRFHHATLETVKLLVDMYPQSLLKEEDSKSYTPLQIAFNHSYSFEVLDYMMSKLPEQMDDFKLVAGDYHKWFTVKIDLAETELISQLLPKLYRFHCQPTQWTEVGFVQLLASLQGNSTIRDFKASNLPGEILSTDSSAVVDALTDLLDHNATLETLGLSVRKEEQDGSDASTFLQSLELCVRSNNNLRSLELSNMRVTIESLVNFLASDYAPKSLILNNFVLFKSSKIESNSRTPTANSKIQKLVISNCCLQQQEQFGDDSSSSSFLRVLDCVAYMKKLKDLTLLLPHFKNLDITVPLVHLLETGSVESATVRGPTAQIKPICAALEQCASLRRFDFPKSLDTKDKQACFARVLENHNARLEHVRISGGNNAKERIEYKRIAYLTRLNQTGRALLRNPNATKALLVKLLVDFTKGSPDCKPEDKVSVIYGLLRETPSLWCHIMQSS